eukprot:3730742-Alexandrium_andersonii.AAC.1
MVCEQVDGSAPRLHQCDINQEWCRLSGSGVANAWRLQMRGSQLEHVRETRPTLFDIGSVSYTHLTLPTICSV